MSHLAKAPGKTQDVQKRLRLRFPPGELQEGLGILAYSTLFFIFFLLFYFFRSNAL